MTPLYATGLLSGALLTACLSWKTQPGFAAACLATRLTAFIALAGTAYVAVFFVGRSVWSAYHG